MPQKFSLCVSLCIFSLLSLTGYDAQGMRKAGQSPMITPDSDDEEERGTPPAGSQMAFEQTSDTWIITNLDSLPSTISSVYTSGRASGWISFLVNLPPQRNTTSTITLSETPSDGPHSQSTPWTPPPFIIKPRDITLPKGISRETIERFLKQENNKDEKTPPQPTSKGED